MGDVLQVGGGASDAFEPGPGAGEGAVGRLGDRNVGVLVLLEQMHQAQAVLGQQDAVRIEGEHVIGVGDLPTALAGPDGHRGDHIDCQNLRIPGLSDDGGYAACATFPTDALAAIPDALTPEDAAPLMCAGVTTFNGLRNTRARAGEVVAVLGVGGLGHLGVQFAAKMGFETVAIARGQDKAAFAHQLGAHHYIDSTQQDVAAELTKLGGASVVLSTVTSAPAMTATVAGLRGSRRACRGGCLAGAARDPTRGSHHAFTLGGRPPVGHLERL